MGTQEGHSAERDPLSNRNILPAQSGEGADQRGGDLLSPAPGKLPQGPAGWSWAARTGKIKTRIGGPRLSFQPSGGLRQEDLKSSPGWAIWQFSETAPNKNYGELGVARMVVQPVQGPGSPPQHHKKGEKLLSDKTQNLVWAQARGLRGVCCEFVTVHLWSSGTPLPPVAAQGVSVGPQSPVYLDTGQWGFGKPGCRQSQVPR